MQPYPSDKQSFKTSVATTAKYIVWRAMIYINSCDKVSNDPELSLHYVVVNTVYASVPLGIFASAVVKCIIIHAMLPDALQF